MAFSLKFGGLMKQAASQNGQAPVISMYNSIRCMSSQLFIGGLSWGTDDQSLRDAFSGFGDVVEARVIIDRESGRSRGFGFVHFASDESANSAISAMDGQELDGRNIRVNLANERPARTDFGRGDGYQSRGYQSRGGGGGGYGGGSDRYGGGDGGF